MVCSDFVDDDERATDCSLLVFVSLHTLLPISHQELEAIPPLLESELAMRLVGNKEPTRHRPRYGKILGNWSCLVLLSWEHVYLVGVSTLSC